MQKKSIELKSSSFIFLVLYLHNDNIDLINKYLYEKFEKYPDFFKNAPIIVNISNLLNVKNWKEIKESILSYGFLIAGVVGCTSQNLKKIIIDSGVPILSDSKTYHMNINKRKKNISCHHSVVHITKKTHIIDKPVRSGQKIYAQNADLIVTNNVSAGAEVVADGNIHIYGVCRGRILAGANGDMTSKIFCTRLFAELISISGEYWLSDQIPIQFFGKSAQICLQKQFLTIHALI